MTARPRCPVRDRPVAESLPAPKGECGREAALTAEVEAEARRAPGVTNSPEVRDAREAADRADADCRAHAVDWRARCLASEEHAERVCAERAWLFAALDDLRQRLLYAAPESAPLAELPTTLVRVDLLPTLLEARRRFASAQRGGER